METHPPVVSHTLTSSSSIHSSIDSEDSVTRLEARLRVIEREHTYLLEQFVKLHGALRGKTAFVGFADPPTSFGAAISRIEELEMRLEDALKPPDPMPSGLEHHLSPIQAKIYALLKRKHRNDPSGYVRKDAVMTALYGLSDNVPSCAGLHVQICHLRRKLPSRERIDTIRGAGWRLVGDCS